MTIEHPTADESEDWADKLALEIALDMHRLGNQIARSITANRLRIVKAEGKLEGATEAGNAIIKILDRGASK